MAVGLLPDEGIGDQLAYLLSAPIPGVLPWQLIIWVNDIQPDADTVFDDLLEASWSGYSRLTLDRSTWTVPTVSNGCAVSTYGTVPLVYMPSGDLIETNYGAAYYDASKDVLRWIQRFEDGDIAPIVPGRSWSILPQYTLTSSTCGSALMAARRRARARKKR